MSIMGSNIFCIEATNGAELSLEVEYTTKVYGEYIPATMESPEEPPEVEVEVEDDAYLQLPNGKWISYPLSRLPRATYDALMRKVDSHAIKQLDNYCDGDYPEDDDYDDPRSYNVDCSTDSYGRNILP